jgi:hypothetical protein
MLPNATHVLDHARLLILDRVPLDEMAGRVTAVMMRVRPSLSVKGGGRQIVVEEIRHHLVGEQLHSAVRVMDHEPLASAEQLVRDDEGPTKIAAILRIPPMAHPLGVTQNTTKASL